MSATETMISLPFSRATRRWLACFDWWSSTTLIQLMDSRRLTLLTCRSLQGDREFLVDSFM